MTPSTNRPTPTRAHLLHWRALVHRQRCEGVHQDATWRRYCEVKRAYDAARSGQEARA